MGLSIASSDCALHERTSPSQEGKAPSLSSTSAHLSRQVSNDGLASISDTEGDKSDCASSACSSGRTSPGRCVSEFDKAATSCRKLPTLQETSDSIPVHNPKFLEVHSRALRLEAELQPMRLILSRLMFHPTLNRKGVFNAPVDPIALRLPDYHDVIKKPMDLGLIKVKLHAIAYLSRQDVADDIRLVFRNAMLYNPPHNAVHVAAKELLAFFEDQLHAFAPELCQVRGSEPALQSAVLLNCAPSEESTERALPDVPTIVHNQGTRNSASSVEPLPPLSVVKKRAKRGSKVNPDHACYRCRGRTCMICHQGCLPLESALLICNGAQCAGTRIRKGAVYFVSADGGRHFCQRCHTSLPAVLPQSGHDEQIRYKRDLLKRKNDEEIVEPWLNCSQCDGSVHKMCALLDEYVHDKDSYRCPDCVAELSSSAGADDNSDAPTDPDRVRTDELFTFVSGSEVPVKLSEVAADVESRPYTAESLPENEVSSFIQRRVRERMRSDEYPNADRTVLVRIVSDSRRCFKVPDVVRTHFRMPSRDDQTAPIAPPAVVNYRSMGISLFQKIDGIDVCIFCMYVHEYDGNDQFDDEDGVQDTNQKKRVYIAYLDSVEHFRPRSLRTSVYHEILVAYLATARKRGFEVAHIWSCPPSRGNCFVFWNHPASQRTPNPERLESWYHQALSRAVDCGVVTDVQSLYEANFKSQVEEDDATRQRGFPHCPPLLDGDFWIEEAVRLHSLNMARNLKTKVDEPGAASVLPVDAAAMDRCPAMQVASLLRDCLIPHPAALPFRRPVNAAAMNLADYHTIITNPMDLGTVYSRCVLGEYGTLAELVEDVDLVFSNAKKYNPKGHVVHTKAEEVRDLFFSLLNQVVRTWNGSPEDSSVTWEKFSSTSLSLDVVLEAPAESCGEAQSVEVEPGFFKENKSSDSPNTGRAESVSLVGGGPQAVQQRMVGDDIWLFDKSQVSPKGSVSSKHGSSRRRKCPSGASDDEPPYKRRRQAWLGVEVGAAVRRMRTSFFTCSLVPSSQETVQDREAIEAFQSYSSDFLVATNRECEQGTSTIADVRHSLLEFSQFRNLEFGTLRHAKYSTAVLLHHFHNERAPGVVPVCKECDRSIDSVRWHKVCRVLDLRRRKSLTSDVSCDSIELCDSCYHTKFNQNDQFVPLQVTVSDSCRKETSS